MYKHNIVSYKYRHVLIKFATRVCKEFNQHMVVIQIRLSDASIA